MLKPSLQFVLLSAALLIGPIAIAQPGVSTDTTTNTTGTNQGTFTGTGSAGRRRGAWGGQGQGQRTHIPTRAQVMALPSLTASQRRDIDAIYQQEHQTIRPLIAQLRQQGGLGADGITGDAGNAGSTGGPGPASGMTADPQKMQLIRQIREQRRSTWQTIKAKLTPGQITQLQQQVANGQQLPPNQ